MAKPKFRIVVNANCKGCGLCIEFCPQKAMAYKEEIDGRGFHHACQTDPEKCTGCQNCYLMCPDAAVTIIRVTQTKTAS